jgi:undecaprenyl-diphosphatase
MKLIDALILAVLQGITEFFPISSSGHLVLIQYALGQRDVPILYDLILHLGTTIAVILVYRNVIGEILRDFIMWVVKGKREKRDINERGSLRLLLYISISVCVTGVLGVLSKSILESFYYRPQYVPLFLTFTGMILLITYFIQGGEKGIESIPFIYPIVIGAAQAFAILPGVSRSGTTIAAGLFMGAQRSFAAIFSFLIAIPSVFGASLYEYLKSYETLSMMIDYRYLLLAFAVSLLTGYAALHLLIRFVMKGKIYLFSFYCFAVSIASIFLIK